MITYTFKNVSSTNMVKKIQATRYFVMYRNSSSSIEGWRTKT